MHEKDVIHGQLWSCDLAYALRIRISIYFCLGHSIWIFFYYYNAFQWHKIPMVVHIEGSLVLVCRDINIQRTIAIHTRASFASSLASLLSVDKNFHLNFHIILIILLVNSYHLIVLSLANFVVFWQLLCVVLVCVKLCSTFHFMPFKGVNLWSSQMNAKIAYFMFYFLLCLQFVVNVYNPLGQMASHWVRLPVTGSTYSILDPQGNKVEAQVRSVASRNITHRTCTFCSLIVLLCPWYLNM